VEAFGNLGPVATRALRAKVRRTTARWPRGRDRHVPIVANRLRMVFFVSCLG
jgi:hypothetical protein